MAANLADNILILHSSDVCDLLDQHESIRRAFPQLLSFRELEALLQGQINKSVVARSQSTLDEAKNLLSVFVATTAYTRAFEILRNHHYVVLSGPPEMGKTAIALMIAMFQMTLNWQAILCNKPNDFFQLYDGASKQIFIADDAFGRTEYDTSRGQEWEQDLSRILNRVDSSHWLVWTSRRHILERAMAQIDLQGRARQFPQVAEVIVNADKLSLPEKALILYRHAKAVGLDSEAKEIIKQFAHDIVYNPYFTPERIRRLVEEVLPDLKEQLHNVTLVRTAIIDVLETPTDRVRKTFEKLSGNHKRLLLALLEAGHEANTSELKQLYEDFGAPTEPKMNFETVLDELTESFIRTY